MTLKPVERLIFALDVPTLFDANKYVSILRGHVGAFKVGLELFSSLGPEILRNPEMQKTPILLDLKLHDIPETVRRTVLKFEGPAPLGRPSARAPTALSSAGQYETVNYRQLKQAACSWPPDGGCYLGKQGGSPAQR